MDHIQNCPKCHTVIVKSMGAELKVRAKVIICKGGKTFAACTGCGHESEVPLQLNEPMVKSLHDAQKTGPMVPLYVRSGRK